MNEKELGSILKKMYTDAPRGEQVAMIHLFGIKYHNEIKLVGVKDVIRESGISSTYATEVSKAVSLAKYVRVL
ncbi:MAG TPA: hypothetical protein VF679_08000 [Pedobacter sp.]